MIELLLSLLVLLLVIYVANLIVEALPFPQNVKTVIYLILGVIFLIILLGRLGLFHLRL